MNARNAAGAANGLPVAVLAHAVHVPGADAWQTGLPDAEIAPMADIGEAHTVLGRKGLLGKEPATRLALCAVHRALGLPPGPLANPLPLAERTAVVVSSNLGNLATVCEIAAATRVEGYRAVSPMQTPNVSSNVIASTIAIRYGFTGPNVMLCNGATSGLDAVRIGARLLRAGRAERVVVVGAEPADVVAKALVGSRYSVRIPRQATGSALESRPYAPVLRAAAACVILGAPAAGDERTRVLLREGGMLAPGAAREKIVPTDFRGLMFVPEEKSTANASEAEASQGPDDETVIDLARRLGETYGALGVLQTAAAAARMSKPGAPSEAHLACGDDVEGYAWLRMQSVGSPA